MSGTRLLNDGTSLPAIGLGTGGLAGEQAVDAVLSGLRAGYRLVDSAIRYRNEAEVGEAIRRSGVPRDQLVVTSKLPGSHHAYDRAVEAVQQSLWAFGLEYLDLYLIHWPNPRRGLFIEAWQALVDLQRQGLLRSIGVCNFLPEHLDAAAAATGVMPAVNQIESHPYFPQHELRRASIERGVVPQAWAPLGRRSGVREDCAVAAVASGLGCTPAQAVLAWHRTLGVVPIPMSTSPTRQAENLASLEVELTPEQVATLSGLGRPDGRVSGLDPLVYEDV